jgi:hypothetical protein
MKNILLIISFGFIGFAFSQNLPPGISYSAVAIKKENYNIAGNNVQENYWSSKPIKVRFSIFDKYPGGKIEYSEFHNTRTDNYGIFNLVIGQGQVISGDFQKISWDLGTAHLQVEIDFLNNDDYTLIGIERFWSVPYAFVTRKQKNTSLDSLISDLYTKYNYLRIRDKDTVIGNEVSYLTIDSVRNYYNNAISNLRSRDKDTVIGNEIQSLTLNKDTLELSLGGGKIPLTDLSATNELQQLSKNKDTISLSLNGGKVLLNDDDSLNEIQDLYSKGDTLFLTKSNSNVILSNILKGSSTGISSTPSKGSSMILGEGIRLETFCDRYNINALGIPSNHSILAYGEYKDSLYFMGYWNDNTSLPKNISGEFVVSKSKLNCGVKLLYKSNTLRLTLQDNTPSGLMFLGFINGEFNLLDKNEWLNVYDIKSNKISRIKVAIPFTPNYLGSWSTNIYNIQNKSTRYKDTLYLIYNRMQLIGSSNYIRNYRLYKFNAKTGSLLKIDSNTNYQDYNYGNQTMDSVNYAFCDGKNLICFNYLNLKKDTLFTDNYLNYHLSLGSTYNTFHVFKSGLICIGLTRTYGVVGFTEAILIYDLTLKKAVIQDVRFSTEWSSYFLYGNIVGNVWNMSSKGTNGFYIAKPSGPNMLSYTTPFGYVLPPKILYVK